MASEAQTTSQNGFFTSLWLFGCHLFEMTRLFPESNDCTTDVICTSDDKKTWKSEAFQLSRYALK